MRQKVEFETNKPVFLTLDFNEGVLSPSKKGFGDEYQYVLNQDTQIMWVKPELHALIQRTGAQAGDEICITRKEVKAPGSQRKSVQWEVQMVADEPTQEYDPRQYPAATPPTRTPTPQQQRRQPAPPPEPRATDTRSGSQAALTAQPPDHGMAPQGQPQSITDPAAESALTRALCTALAAARSAELYAAKLGMAVRFGGEDIRALAVTHYIAATKGIR